jgi:hypothetical protein
MNCKLEMKVEFNVLLMFSGLLNYYNEASESILGLHFFGEPIERKSLI